MLTVERLRELLDYDPETGMFRWKAARGCKRSGAIAGYIHSQGYRVIRVDDRPYRASRLAWFHVNGEWPLLEIDHEDTARAHDRITNLRQATHSQNGANRRRRSDNRSGFKGVTAARGKFQARIKHGGRTRHLGFFQAPELAHAAYAAAAREIHGQFARAE